MHPETDIIPHSDIQNDEREKMALLKQSMKKKQKSYANKKLEKMSQNFTKIKILLGIVDHDEEQSNDSGFNDTYERLQRFKMTKEYQNLLNKLETHSKLELKLVEKR